MIPTDATLRRLEGLEEKATKGPWRAHSAGKFVEVRNYSGGVDWVVINWQGFDACDTEPRTKRGYDADLIAESRNALPALLAAARTLLKIQRMVNCEHKHIDATNPSMLRCACGLVYEPSKETPSEAFQVTVADLLPAPTQDQEPRP